MPSPPPRARTAARAQLAPLTSLRFLAALHVVVFHYWTSFHLAPTRPLAVELGYTGVTFFFILSGFILSYAHDVDGRLPADETRTYFVARFARIYPVYILTIVIMYPGLIPSLASSALDHAYRLVWAVSSPLALHAWIPGAACSLNCPNWSISTEVFFYALFPLAFGPVRRHPRVALPLIVGSMIILWIAQAAAWQSTGRSLAAMATTRPAIDFDGDLLLQFLTYFPPMRLPEFLLGIALYGVWRDGENRIPASRLAIAAAIGAVIVVTAAPHLPENVLRNGFAAICHAPLILAAANTASGPLHGRLAVWLGQISFALYLIHSPVDSYLRAVDKALLSSTLAANPVVFFALATTLALASAAVLFHFVEEPARRALMRRYAAHVRRRQTDRAAADRPRTTVPM